MDFPVNWEEIELSESYLVSSMFEEAASVSYSTLQSICKCKLEESVDKEMVEDMIECSGMVWIQAHKELGRTQNVLKDLEILFGSVRTIPVPLLLTWACLLISEKHLYDLQEALEEFLISWKYAEQKRCYILRSAGQQKISFEGHISCSSLAVEKYVEVVKVYVISLLGVVLDNYELASAQLQKADLPEDKRQELLQQLQSVCHRKNSDLSFDCEKLQSAERNDHAVSSTNSNCADESTRAAETVSNDIKLEVPTAHRPALGHFFKAFHSFFLFFRAITLKLGNVDFVMSHGKAMVGGTFIFVILYIVQKKRDLFKRFAARQLSGLKKVAFDAWQLAFSMQVNPLAAIQPPPVVTPGHR